MFKHNTAVDKFGKNKTVDKFEYDETVDKFHSQGQVTICVCTRNVSVREAMHAMSMTPCVTTWFGIALPDYMLAAGKSGSIIVLNRLVICSRANIMHSHSVLCDLRVMCCEHSCSFCCTRGVLKCSDRWVCVVLGK